MLKSKKYFLWLLTLINLLNFANADDRRVNYSYLNALKVGKFCDPVIGDMIRKTKPLNEIPFASQNNIQKCLTGLYEKSDPRCFVALDHPQPEAATPELISGYKPIKINLNFNIAILHSSSTKEIKYTLIDIKTNKVEISNKVTGDKIKFSVPLVYELHSNISGVIDDNFLNNLQTVNESKSYKLLISGLNYKKHQIVLQYFIRPYISNLKFKPLGAEECRGQKTGCYYPVQLNPYYRFTSDINLAGFDPDIVGVTDYWGYWGRVGVEGLSPMIPLVVNLNLTDDIKNAGCGFVTSGPNRYFYDKCFDSTWPKDDPGKCSGPQGGGFYGFNDMTFNFDITGKLDAQMNNYVTYRKAALIKNTYVELSGDRSDLR